MDITKPDEIIEPDDEKLVELLKVRGIEINILLVNNVIKNKEIL